MDRKFREAIIHECRDHFAHDAVSPKFLTQPKAEFSDMPMDVLANANADAANPCLTDVDAKICHGLLRRGAAQEFLRVLDCIRMRKQIAQPKPNAPVVCVLCEGRRIIGTPCANRAPFESELHYSAFVEFDPGLLHFTVRQEPDQRFIVKIDNLNAVAPRVTEIAAERRFEL